MMMIIDLRLLYPTARLHAVISVVSVVWVDIMPERRTAPGWGDYDPPI